MNLQVLSFVLHLLIYRLCFVHKFNFWLFNGFAALVPLEELRELNFTKQYGIARDPEVIDLLDTAWKTKGVCYVMVLISCCAVNMRRKYGGKALSV